MSLDDLLTGLQANWLNTLAVVWFFICFRGYFLYAEAKRLVVPSLSGVMHAYRLQWILSIMDRDNRVADVTTIANLERGVAFFASTTLLILAGLMTVLGSTEKAIDIVAELPFSTVSTQSEWKLKLLLLIFLFIYAFFKFTWSLRQYGFVSVMVGGSPMPDQATILEEKQKLANNIALMSSMAASNFNSGLRTYYFCMAVLGWFINSWLFMAFTILVVLVLYRREFRSRTLHILNTNVPKF